MDTGEKIAVVGSVFVASIGVIMLLAMCGMIIDSTYHHYQEDHLNQESNEPKDTRPKIPDCGMSTWDEIRGECNDTKVVEE